MEILQKLVWHYDEPFADKSAIPTFYLCREAAKEVKVALSGDGGDEAFAGYSKYIAAERSYLFEKVSGWAEERWGDQLLQALWKGEGGRLGYAVRRKLFRTLFPMASSLYYTEFFDGQMKKDLLKEGVQKHLRYEGLDQLLSLWEDARSKFSSTLDQMLRVDLSWYLPGDLLVKMDIASMAHGLEVRSPFLDHRLLEFAFSLPPCYKVSGGETKFLLKRVVASFVPQGILTRKKMGFSLPLKEWFRGELQEFVRDTLLGPSLAMDRFFNRTAVERLVQGHLSGKENHTFRLWALILFNLWHKRFIEGEGSLMGIEP
jgi:asparagine synthase (glutamine-hydrolysing)